MKIRAYIKRGPHITQQGGSVITYAFGVMVNELATNPYLEIDCSAIRHGLPSNLLSVIKSFSVQDKFDGGNRAKDRAMGKYRFKDATATVERNANCHHSIHAEGTDLQEVVKLIELIRAGQIPPTVSYEAGQVKSYAASVREAFHSLIEALARFYDRCPA